MTNQEKPIYESSKEVIAERFYKAWQSDDIAYGKNRDYWFGIITDRKLLDEETIEELDNIEELQEIACILHNAKSGPTGDWHDQEINRLLKLASNAMATEILKHCE